MPTNLISTDHQEQVIKYLLLLFPLKVPYCASLENSSPISDLFSFNCNHAKYFVNWHYMDEVNWEMALTCVEFKIQSVKIPVTNLEDYYLMNNYFLSKKSDVTNTYVILYWYRTDIQSAPPPMRARVCVGNFRIQRNISINEPLYWIDVLLIDSLIHKIEWNDGCGCLTSNLN